MTRGAGATGDSDRHLVDLVKQRRRMPSEHGAPPRRHVGADDDGAIDLAGEIVHTEQRVDRFDGVGHASHVAADTEKTDPGRGPAGPVEAAQHHRVDLGRRQAVGVDRLGRPSRSLGSRRLREAGAFLGRTGEQDDRTHLGQAHQLTGGTPAEVRSRSLRHASGSPKLVARQLPPSAWVGVPLEPRRRTTRIAPRPPIPTRR